MANPFAASKTFHKLGNFTNTPVFRMMPTPTGIALVTTKGRKSGKLRARPMRAVRDGSRVYAVAILGERADWLRNVRADPNVRIKLGGTTYSATAREITDRVERARAEEIYRPIAGWYDYFDYANFLWTIPTRKKVLHAHDNWFAKGIPVVFELADAI